MSSDTVDIGAYIGVIYSMLFFGVSGIVVYFAEPGFPWHTYFTLIVGYFCAFGILLLVPIDIASVIIDRRSTVATTYDADVHMLSQAYKTFFTFILILGSFVLVFEEYYNTDGYKYSNVDVAGVVVGVIILGILISQKVVPADSSALLLSAVIVTNTLYEGFLMFLLGYGLVEFPRSIWMNSILKSRLLRVQMQASSDYKNITEAQHNVSLACSDVNKTKEQLAAYGDPKLNEAMAILLTEAPAEFTSSRLGKVATNKGGQITIDSLAGLRTRLNLLKDRYRMSQARSEGTKLIAYQLEDLNAAVDGGQGVVHWSLEGKDSSRAEYLWLCVQKPILMKILAIFLFLLSLLSFIGVVCSLNAVSGQNSPYFVMAHSNSSSPTAIVIFIFITLGYSTYVALWSLFQMRLAGMMELVPHRTTPESLSFNVRMCARLAAPLAFFYLGWISENGIKTGDWINNSAPDTYMYSNGSFVNHNGTMHHISSNSTLEAISNAVTMPSAFSNFYQLQSVYVIKQTFGTLFPILLFCVICLIVPNLYNRICILIKQPDLQFGAEIVTDEQLREGKRQLEKFKKTTANKINRDKRREHILNIRSGAVPVVGGMLTALWSVLRPGSAGQADGAAGAGAQAEVAEMPALTEPAKLSGAMERKGTSKFGVGSSWAEMFGEVRSPGTLHLYKDAKAAKSATTNPADIVMIDLRLISNFEIPVKKNKEHFQLDLVLLDECIKLRFKSQEELDKWKTGLMDWKDYANDFQIIYPGGRGSMGSGNDDIESGANPMPSAKSRAAASASSASAGAGKGKSDLDSVLLEEVSDEEVERAARPLIKGGKSKPPPASSARGAAGGSAGRNSGSGSGSGSAARGGAAKAAADDDKPRALEGWLEKKSNAKVHVGSDWQRRYCRVDVASSSLMYFKTDNPSEKPSGSINLTEVVDISAYDKGGKADTSRFNMNLGDTSKVYKFKAANGPEGERWINELNNWRDYCLMHMHA